MAGAFECDMCGELFKEMCNKVSVHMPEVKDNSESEKVFVSFRVLKNKNHIKGMDVCDACHIILLEKTIEQLRNNNK